MNGILKKYIALSFVTESHDDGKRFSGEGGRYKCLLAEVFIVFISSSMVV